MADEVDFLVAKYQLVVKNIEFLDSYVPKGLAVYATFVAIALVNTEKITREPVTTIFFMLFFVAVTLTLYFLLRRISFLVLQQKQTAQDIEKKVQIKYDLGKYKHYRRFGKKDSAQQKSLESLWGFCCPLSYARWPILLLSPRRSL